MFKLLIIIILHRIQTSAVQQYETEITLIASTDDLPGNSMHILVLVVWGIESLVLLDLCWLLTQLIMRSSENLTVFQTASERLSQERVGQFILESI